MAKTLLNGVNEVLKRVGVLTSDTGELSTITDSAKQIYIDVAIQSWNEVVEELYSMSVITQPNELAESTLTIATSDRDYTLDSALTQLRFPMVDSTNGRYIEAYPGGYQQMKLDQASSVPDGVPYLGAIRETDGLFYIDSLPGSDENNLAYTYWYDKDISVATAAGTWAFKDVVFRALVPAVAEVWRRNRNKTFDPNTLAKQMGIAGRYLTQKQQRNSWAPQRVYSNPTDPIPD